MNRLEKALGGIDPKAGPGLEIGPLLTPMVTKEMADIFYVDHLDTEGLQAKYANDPNVDQTRLCPVDYVWNETVTLAEAVGDRRHAYCLASHVIEHAPDLIGWLNQIGSVLETGGVIGLVIPDARYTFDCRRPPSRPDEVIGAHLGALRRPSPTHILGQALHYSEVTAAQAWAGAYHDEPALTPERARWAHDLAHRILHAGTYRDVHCWVFTPLSFLDLVTVLQKARLLPFDVLSFHETVPGDIEFFATLRKTDDLPAAIARTQALANSIRERDLGESAAVAAACVNLMHDVGSVRRLATRLHEQLMGGQEHAERLRRAEAQRDALERQLAAMRLSSSWRITAPLRAAVTLLRGRRGGRAG